MKIIVQMYSLGDEPGKDLEMCLKKIKEYGYDGIELCGLCGKTPEEYKTLLDKYGLSCPSAHVGIPGKDNYDTYFKEYETLGVKYLIVPWMDPYTTWFPRCYFDRTIASFNDFSKEAAKHGMKVGFHNHFGEFCEVYGKTILENLYENTTDDFVLEVDVAWAEFGSDDDGAKTIEKYHDKACEICHIKSIARRDFPDNATYESGCVNIPLVVETLKKYNPDCIAVVEQEKPYDMSVFDGIRIGREYLAKLV